MSETFTPEEVTEIRRLLDIEKIKKTKMLYSQLTDSRNIDALLGIFTDDAKCDFGPYGSWEGRDEIAAGYRRVFETDTAVNGQEPYGGFHVTTNQWVELTGPTTAVSRTYLIDTIHLPDPRTDPVIWYGLYDEDYEKIGSDWKIKRCTLEYLWPQRIITDVRGEPWPGPFPPKQ